MKPWCYVAHKDGYWAGFTAPGKHAGEFLADFANEGFTITTVHSREEYDALVKPMKSWRHSPEYKAKHAAGTLPLFEETAT